MLSTGFKIPLMVFDPLTSSNATKDYAQKGMKIIAHFLMDSGSNKIHYEVFTHQYHHHNKRCVHANIHH